VDLVHAAEHAISEQFDGAPVVIEDGYVFVVQGERATRYRLVME
jgi:hypothetical protein